MAKFGRGTITMACPVCGDDWEVSITGQMLLGRRPGRAVTKVTVAKPIRIPAKHRKCVGKVD